MSIPNIVISLPRFAQSWFFLDDTNDNTGRSPSNYPYFGSCTRGFSSQEWGPLPPSWRSGGACCPSTLTVLPAKATVVIVLDFYVARISQWSLGSCLVLCNSCLLHPVIPCCWCTGVLGPAWCPHTPTGSPGPWGCKLQVGQHGVLLACTPPTSWVTHSIPCDSLCWCICCLEISFPNSSGG